MKINFVDLEKQYENLDVTPLIDLIKHGQFVGGKALEEFEDSFAKYCGTKYAVGVGSGTDALWLSLKALGIGVGDEVIVPANTYIATAFAVSHTGAKPVFVDPNPETYTIDAESIEDAITTKTRAIIPVHLYGYPADMDGIMGLAETYELFIVEDCAQSAGAIYKGKRTGSFDAVGCYSFYPTKNLGGLGQGGAVVTNEEFIADYVREMGNVGRSSGSWFDYSHVGFNSRLDTINAKFLSYGLATLDYWNNHRVKVANWYYQQLKDVANVKTPLMKTDEIKPVFHLYELKCEDKITRDLLKDFLNKNNISTSLHYPKPCHQQIMYKNFYSICPISDNLSDTLLSLPMHPTLLEEEVTFICDIIKEFFNTKK
jgi:dTDP-4-amino-4,6-dideoxygalactose transaminase